MIFWLNGLQNMQRNKQVALHCKVVYVVQSETRWFCLPTTCIFIFETNDQPQKHEFIHYLIYICYTSGEKNRFIDSDR